MKAGRSRPGEVSVDPRMKDGLQPLGSGRLLEFTNSANVYSAYAVGRGMFY